MTDDKKQTTVTDKQLIFETLCGSNSAFGIIVERYWNMAIALALTKIADPVEAEDIAQESFLKAYSQLHKLRDPSRFAGWLSKIVSQQCIESARKNTRHKKVLSNKATALEGAEMKFTYASNPGLSQSQANSIRQAVHKLPEKFRDPVIMRFVAGLTAVQIAEQLGKRPGTVRVWLHRACNTLRRDLAPLFEEVIK